MEKTGENLIEIHYRFDRETRTEFPGSIEPSVAVMVGKRIAVIERVPRFTHLSALVSEFLFDARQSDSLSPIAHQAPEVRDINFRYITHVQQH